MKKKKAGVMRASLFVLVLVFIIGMALSVSAATETASYVTRSWNAVSKTVTSATKGASATVLTSADSVLGQLGNETYYVVSSATASSSSISVYGTVHLILGNKYTLTNEINVYENSTLHIHEATSAITPTLSAKRIQLRSGNSNVYIHGGNVEISSTIAPLNDSSFGSIVIYGGNVSAQSIGAAESSASAPDTPWTGQLIGIYGGTITVTNELSGVPAIGVDHDKTLNSLEIYNASVTAKKLPINAYSDTKSPVIGANEGTVNSIVIRNANLKVYSHAINDARFTEKHYGTPIGSGYDAHTGSISIIDSTLTIESVNSAAAIGRAFFSSSTCDSITVSGSSISVSEPYLCSKATASAGLAAKNVSVTSSEIIVDLEQTNSDPAGWGLYADESITINSGSFDFHKTLGGIESKGSLVINGGLFSGTVKGATVKDSSGNDVYEHTIQIAGFGKKAITSVTLDSGSYSVEKYSQNPVSNVITLYLSPKKKVTMIQVGSTEYGGSMTGTATKTGTFYAKCNCSSFTNGVCRNCGSLEPAELEDGYYLIRDFADLEYFKAVVEGGLKNGSIPNGQVNAKLMADISMGSGSYSVSSNYIVSVSSSTVNGITIGTLDAPFQGVFDGNGYTITYYYRSPDNETGYFAPFLVADGATFKNLTVAGAQYVKTVGGVDGVGGIVAYVTGNQVTFEKCLVKSAIHMEHSTSSKGCMGTYDVGGFVGYADAPVVIKHSAFLGNIFAEQINGVSYMIGNSADNVKVTVTDSFIYGNMRHYFSESVKNSFICRNEDHTYVYNTYVLSRLSTEGSGGYSNQNKQNANGKNEFYNLSVLDEHMITDGELTYKLNKGSASGVWKQTLSGDTPDALPNFTGATVAYNVGSQSYDNHTHAPVYSLATVNSTNDSIRFLCTTCATEGEYITIVPPNTLTYAKNTTFAATLINPTLSTYEIQYFENGVPLSGAPTNAGTYVAQISYSEVTASITFTVKKANGFINFHKKPNKTYDGIAVDLPGFSTPGTGAVTIEFKPVSGGYEYTTIRPVDANEYYVRVTVAADRNYNAIEKTTTFTVKKAPLTVQANDHTIVYGDAPANGGVSYTGFVGTDTYLVLGGSLEIANTYVAHFPVGTYVLTPSGYISNNYEITYMSGTLNVTKRAVSFTTFDQSITAGQSIDNTKYTAPELVVGHTVHLAANGGEIVLDKILDTSNNDVTENYAVAYASKGVYHCFDEAAYVSDGTEHWHPCVVDGCLVTYEPEACNGGTATCTARAVCEVCQNEHGALDQNNHSFTKYVSDKNATAEADGTKTANCDRGCGKTHSVTERGSSLVTAVESFDANKVKQEDKEAINSMIAEIDELLKSNELSEDERAELTAAKLTADELLTALKNNEEKEAETKPAKNFGGIAIAAIASIAVLGGITAAYVVIIRKKRLGKKTC